MDPAPGRLCHRFQIATYVNGEPPIAGSSGQPSVTSSGGALSHDDGGPGGVTTPPGRGD